MAGDEDGDEAGSSGGTGSHAPRYPGIHLKEFAGDSAEELSLWLTKLDFYFEVQHVPEDLKYPMLAQVVGDKLLLLLEQQDLASQITEDKPKYKVATDFLRTIFKAERNILTERVNFMAHKRSPGQSVRDFSGLLREKVKYCNYQACCQDEFLRDVFCRGLAEHYPDTMLAVTRAFSAAMSKGDGFTLSNAITAAEVEETAHAAADSEKLGVKISATGAIAHGSFLKDLCWNCGNKKHAASACPAKDAACNGCGVIGHFQKCCPKSSKNNRGRGQFRRRSRRRRGGGPGRINAVVSTLAQIGERKMVDVTVNGHTHKWLVDTGSPICVVSKEFAKTLKLRWSRPRRLPNAESASGHKLKLLGSCDVTLECQGHFLPAKVYVAAVLTDAAILGSSVLEQFKGLFVKYGRSLEALVVGSIDQPNYSWVLKENGDLFDKSDAVWKIPPQPCIKVEEGARPIAVPSRRFAPYDREFIKAEVTQLLKDGIIEKSRSEWRAQPVVVKIERKAKRLVIDYSTTVNLYTIPDAYPIPRIDEVLEEMGSCHYFSVFDLGKAYYQVPLPEDERPFTAFEAAGDLYQYTRFSLGLSDAVPCFQRAIDSVCDGLNKTRPILDDVLVGGTTREVHDANVKAFLSRAREKGLSFNSKKCSFGVTRVAWMGHILENGTIKRDPSRLKPLIEYPIPHNATELASFLGMAVYHSKWIPGFATLIEPLRQASNQKSFPLNQECLDAIAKVKDSIADAVLSIPDPDKPLTLEVDASGIAIAGELSQDGRPVYFVHHRFTPSEKRWSNVEREAYAVIHSIDKTRHFLRGSKHPFRLVTDNQGVAYLFDGRPKSKIKNDKLSRWRLELSSYNYSIEHKPGKENVSADAFSRCLISSLAGTDEPVPEPLRRSLLYKCHNLMGHPGIGRTLELLQREYSWPKMKESVTEWVGNCHVCAKVKPRFYKAPPGHVVTSKAPWERISVDFSGPKPRTRRGNTILLTVVDEFSRFPFAWAVKNETDSTLMEYLEPLFCLFGPPLEVHSDRGSAFLSKRFLGFLQDWGVRPSRTSGYNPQGNGQCERFNGIIWNTVQSRLQQDKLPNREWDTELGPALANIRTLHSEAIGTNPHSLFCRFDRRCAHISPVKRVDWTPTMELPKWLAPGETVQLKVQVRRKNDPKTELVKVKQHLSSHNALVEREDGTEKVVHLKNLAPAPEPDPDEFFDAQCCPPPTGMPQGNVDAEAEELPPAAEPPVPSPPRVSPPPSPRPPRGRPGLRAHPQKIPEFQGYKAPRQFPLKQSDVTSWRYEKDPEKDADTSSILVESLRLIGKFANLVEAGLFPQREGCDVQTSMVG